ncbi:Tetratricopeptide repeat protein [Botrimarina colliarenosi]|uniref:Tetratricopeptide repeat protein n=1 Tax=Botrimarina colliarenosi TaxID=2528001 RepID=A0A5C6AC20_9BACT|nr:hypothetical protein [Botrimarina colliarenosi]TWT96868.1 Tetratricopeptide repeat protein [Botrimarina colliarenosi]
MRLLRATPLLALGLLVGTLSSQVAAAPGEAEVAELIEQLGHPLYEERLDAQRRLTARGLEAFDALRDAQDDPDPEVADASRRLLADLTSHWARRSDPPQVRQWLAAYNTGLAGRELDVIEALASMEGVDAIPALARIARFEPSDLAAREAARALLVAPEFGVDARRQNAVSEAVRSLIDEYGPGRRPASDWIALAAEEAAGSDPPPAAWRRHAESQRALLDTGSEETSEEIVATLGWRWLRSALLSGAEADAAAAAELLVTFDEDEAAGRLARAIRWAAEAGRWSVVDQLTTTYADRLLGKQGLYVLADAALRRGDQDAADRLAAEALAAPPSDTDTSVEDVLLGPRVLVARQLYEAGRTEWAIAEYRAAAQSDDPLDGRAAVAAWRLANLLFDAERYEEAAAALQPIAAAIERSRPSRDEYDNLPQEDRQLLPGSGQLLARQRFSAALAYRQVGDREEEMKALRRAISADPRDADVLIAMHRVQDAPPEFVEKAKQLIDARRRDYERDVWEDPDEADGYNQWAWLVSNTYGDFDKAVRYSRRSLEIEPETAGYLDTLGRCLFSAGRVEEAIEVQRRAVELEPRMLVLQRQLAEFEFTLATKEGGE